MTPDYMAEALALARRGTALTSPNPMVGAVIVRDGEIVGRGFHTWAGLKHAEILALEDAGERAQGATIYLTLEPCAHTGRTGPCADALIAAGIAKVVVASEDPNPLVAGEGLRRLRASAITVEMSPEHRDIAEKLNETFLHFMRTGRPLVTLKSAVTLDGKIAAPEDNTGWITSERARAHVQVLRHAHDAIITGIGTVLSDNPRLNDRSELPRARPLLRVVLDSTLRIPLTSQLVRTAKDDLLIATTSAASPDRGVSALESARVWSVSQLRRTSAWGEADSSRDVISLLGERRLISAMFEAGSKMNWAALESGAVDKVFLYYAPKILGGTESLPMAGGAGRMSRMDAIQLHKTALHPIPPDEFAVEAFIKKCSPE